MNQEQNTGYKDKLGVLNTYVNYNCLCLDNIILDGIKEDIFPEVVEKYLKINENNEEQGRVYYLAAQERLIDYKVLLELHLIQPFLLYQDETREALAITKKMLCILNL